MASLLTKIDKNGELYRRPREVDAQIDETLMLPLAEIRARLQIKNLELPGHLRSECLVHLMRLGRREGNQGLMNAVLPVLLDRCEANLRIKVPDGLSSAASDVRQQILDDLAELFAVDGIDNPKNELDYFECRFNRAFRMLRIDAIRIESKARENFQTVDVQPPDEIEVCGPHDEFLARVTEVYRVAPTQEWQAMRESLMAAIQALPADEREAVILVHVLGYKEESEDPDIETAATRCKCSGRTIRNRLTRAAKRLAEFKEFLEVT